MHDIVSDTRRAILAREDKNRFAARWPRHDVFLPLCHARKPLNFTNKPILTFPDPGPDGMLRGFWVGRVPSSLILSRPCRERVLHTVRSRGMTDGRGRFRSYLCDQAKIPQHGSTISPWSISIASKCDGVRAAGAKRFTGERRR
jgi:hypothetical protein